MRSFRDILLTILKWAGFFALARIVTRRGLRILAYHGVSVDDEHLFRPGLFVKRETFKRRLDWLKNSGLPVLPLEQAMQMLRSGTLPAGATVITFDDGWYTSYEAGQDLCRLSLPATYYITTYFVTRQWPIFNLFVAYAMWRQGKQTVMLDGREQAASDISDLHMSNEVRMETMRRVAEMTGTSFDEVAASRRFGLMNEAEISDLIAKGFDVQLHTHRHHFSSSPEKVREEILDNRAVLEKLTGETLRHFCYPSGRYFADSGKVLEQNGIESAVTCSAGINYPGQDPFALYRILDSERVSQIQFEAELSGLLDIVRRMRARWTNVPLTAPLEPQHASAYPP